MKSPAKMGRPTGDSKRFGLWLDEVMHRRGMTQSALAKEAKVSQGMVSRWVQGVSAPSPQSVRAIAAVLQVPVGEAMRQAGHIQEVVEVEGAPERDRLHQLVDLIPLDLVGPYITVFEALVNKERSDD